MKSKAFWLFAQMAVIILAVSTGAVGQNPRPVKVSGTISDYTQLSPGAQVWEMRGTWSLKVKGDSGTADFAAALSMEHSDLGMINGAATRTPHTHHITLTDAQVISDATLVAGICPSAHYTPATTIGFAITGLASTSGNGAYAPFAPHGELSQLTVCVTGSDQVAFSNVTLSFAATNPDGTKTPAAGHFGTQPINGVVKSVKPSRGDDK